MICSLSCFAQDEEQKGNLLSFLNEKQEDTLKADSLPPHLIIPYENDYDTIIFCDTCNNHLNIGLCIPLLEDSIYSEEAFENSLFINNQLIDAAFNFYTGAYLAFDSLKKEYPFIQLHIFDSSIDTFNIDSLLKSEKLKSMDILIGPLLDRYFAKTIKYCDTNQIFTISPSKNTVQFNSAFYRKSTAPLESYYDSISSLLHSRYDSSIKKVFINPNRKDNNFTNYKSYFDSVPNLKMVHSKRPTISAILDSSEIDIIEDSIIYKRSRLDHRIIFINSIDESFVYRVFSELDRVSDSVHFTVIGLPNWENFESIDISFYNNFNVIFGSNYFVNYKSNIVSQFRNRYYKTFKIEPSKYAFLGYDNMLFHVKDLLNEIKDSKYKGLTTSFNMISIKNQELSKENSFFHLLQFINGQIVKLQ